MTKSQISASQPRQRRTDGAPPAMVAGPGQGQDQKLQFAQFWVDHAREAAFWISSDGLFQYVNNAACPLLGYSREELLSMSLHNIDPNYPRESWEEHWQVLQKGLFN